MNLVLRAYSLAFLAWHLGRMFPGLAEPTLLATAAVAGLAGGVLTRGFRPWVSFPVGLGVFLAVQWAATALPVWVAGTDPSALDTVPLWAGRQMVFAALPFGLAWLEGWVFTGRSERRWVERLINGLAVAVLFWSQGPYHVTLYDHPLALALVFGTFLASELVLLAGHPRRFGPWAPVLLVVAAGVGLLWGLLGRYEDQSTSSGGGLMKPDLFQFDFAPLVRLEDEITLGENLVLLYREDGPPKKRYLRRLVLDSYDPTQGFSSAGAQEPAVGRQVRKLLPTGGTSERIPVRQEYYLVNLAPTSLFALNEPVAVTPFAQWDHSSFVNAYQVDSLVAGDSFWLYNEVEEDGLTPELRALDTQGGEDPEIRDLARQMTAGARTPFEKASAVEQYLRDHYYYSLKPGSPGPRGALKHFLFEGKKGYCSYFAFSMTLLLRSVGVPARISVGFVTNPTESVLGFNPIRAFQAHAWVEVPLGPYGWVEFDPTSSTLAPGEQFQFPRASDPDELSKLISEILGAKPHPLADTAAPGAPPPSAVSWDQVWAAGTQALPWALAFLVLGANEAWRHRWRWARFRASDGRTKALVWWAEVVAQARLARKGPWPGEAPAAWALRDPELAPLAAVVGQVRYGRSPDPDLVRQVPSLARTQRLRFTRLRPRQHRWASLLFPWWPR